MGVYAQFHSSYYYNDKHVETIFYKVLYVSCFGGRHFTETVIRKTLMPNFAGNASVIRFLETLVRVLRSLSNAEQE